MGLTLCPPVLLSFYTFCSIFYPSPLTLLVLRESRYVLVGRGLRAPGCRVLA